MLARLGAGGAGDGDGHAESPHAEHLLELVGLPGHDVAADHVAEDAFEVAVFRVGVGAGFLGVETVSLMTASSLPWPYIPPRLPQVVKEIGDLHEEL